MGMEINSSNGDDRERIEETTAQERLGSVAEKDAFRSREDLIRELIEIFDDDV